MAGRPARAQPAATSVPASSDRSTAAQPSVQPYSPPQPGPPQPYSPPPSLPQAYPPQPYPPPPICPVCPAGTFCQNGYCVLAYYSPSCPVGMVLDGLGNCLPAGYVQYPPAIVGPDPEEERRFELRVKNRMRPKLTLDLEGALGIMGSGSYGSAVAPSLLALVGYRQNYAPWFGLRLRAGLLLGVATFSSSSSSCDSSYTSSCSTTDSTRLLGGILEVAPFFGPFGRFFFGPLLWGGYLDFGTNELHSGTDYVVLDSGAIVGFGGQIGFALGDREQTVLSFSSRVAYFNKVTVFVTAGIGFDL